MAVDSPGRFRKFEYLGEILTQIENILTPRSVPQVDSIDEKTLPFIRDHHQVKLSSFPGLPVTRPVAGSNERCLSEGNLKERINKNYYF